MSDKRAIGVFDSGIGGVTVLSKLIEQFPHENFIYVGDTLNCPYGVKTSQEIQDLVTKVTKFLLNQDVKAIVIACNTATANSAHLSKITDIPVVGVIEPTAKYAYKHSKGKNIAVLATNATIDSGKYKYYLEKHLFKRGKKYYVKCSEFVPIVENLEMNTDKSGEIVAKILAPLANKKIDTIILGCTHFGLLSKDILKIIPNTNLVDCGKPTGKYLQKVLEKSELLTDNNGVGNVKVYTTGDPDSMTKQIVWFDKEHEEVRKIHL